MGLFHIALAALCVVMIAPATAQTPAAKPSYADCGAGSEVEELPPHCASIGAAQFVAGTVKIWPRAGEGVIASIDMTGALQFQHRIAKEFARDKDVLPAGQIVEKRIIAAAPMVRASLWCASIRDRKARPLVLCFVEAKAGETTDWYRIEGATTLASGQRAMPPAKRGPAPELVHSPQTDGGALSYALLFDRLEPGALVAHVANVTAAGEANRQERRIERERDGGAILDFMGARYKLSFNAAGAIASMQEIERRADVETPLQRVKREGGFADALVEFLPEGPLDQTKMKLKRGEVAVNVAVRSGPSMRQESRPEADAKFGAAGDVLTPALIGKKTIYCRATAEKFGYCLADYDADGAAERIFDAVAYGPSRILPEQLGKSRPLTTAVRLQAAPDAARIHERFVYAFAGFEMVSRLDAPGLQRMAMFHVFIMPMGRPNGTITMALRRKEGFSVDDKGAGRLTTIGTTLAALTAGPNSIEFVRTAPVPPGIRALLGVRS